MIRKVMATKNKATTNRSVTKPNGTAIPDPGVDPLNQQERRLWGLMKRYWARITVLAAREASQLGQAGDYAGMADCLAMASTCNQVSEYLGQPTTLLPVTEQIIAAQAPKARGATA